MLVTKVFIYTWVWVACAVSITLVGWMLSITTAGGITLLTALVFVLGYVWAERWIESANKIISEQNKSLYTVESGDIVVIDRYPTVYCKVLLVDRTGRVALLKSIRGGDQFEWGLDGLWLIDKSEEDRD